MRMVDSEVLPVTRTVEKEKRVEQRGSSVPGTWPYPGQGDGKFCTQRRVSATIATREFGEQSQAKCTPRHPSTEIPLATAGECGLQ